MAENGNTPSWLNELEREGAAWAADYLLKRWPDGLEPTPNPKPSMVFTSLAESIHVLDGNTAGVKLIERLRNAIRQRRYRLAEGGRKTCSFTLPTATKAKLKTLAKRHKTTETGLIERLIEAASKQVAIQKEETRHESQAMKAIRNARKLEQELAKVRIDETEKQLHHCLKQLARWEAFLRKSNRRYPPKMKLPQRPS